MEKILTVIQFAFACIVLACALTGVAAHIIVGNITSMLGYVVSMLPILLGLSLTILCYKEMRAEFKK